MRLHKLNPQQGYDKEALQISERARARLLLELLAEAKVDIRQGVDIKLIERERNLQKNINAKEQARIKLLQSDHANEQEAAANQEIDALLTEFQQAQAEIRQTSPRYASLTQPKPLELKEIQSQILDDDTLLLEYSLGAKQSYLWLVSANAFVSYELPKSSEIEAAAQEFYRLLTARITLHGDINSGATTEQQHSEAELELKKTAAQLSRMLLGAVAAQLGKKRLLIVAEGALQYVPFGALSLSTESAEYQPLLIDHEIVNLPSISTLAILRKEQAGRKPAEKAVALLADPVFDIEDKRIKAKPAPNARAGEELAEIYANSRIFTYKKNDAGKDILYVPRLPFTRQEALSISNLMPKSDVLQALDFNASKATALSQELSRYRYIHFATHGYLDSERPELSAIVLSTINEIGAAQDGFLRANEIYNLNLPAELVTLSACETGLGKEIQGEGLVGLTRGFMYAGAMRVVVSLWSINDKATSILMTKFYQKMLIKGERPASALRAAQVEMWQEKEFHSPYYWAAFVLQGDFR
jgi:CHAT domain-containing protein